MEYTVKLPIWQGDNIINIAIREKTLLEAIRKREPLIVVWGEKRKAISPEDWLKNGTLIEKVFLIKDTPMRLRQNTIHFDEPKTAEEIKMEFCKENY
jgi:hypothetical protein